jgi:hypothetical protein
VISRTNEEKLFSQQETYNCNFWLLGGKTKQRPQIFNLFFDKIINPNLMDSTTIIIIEILVVAGIVYFLPPTEAEQRDKNFKYNYTNLVIFGFILLAMMTTNPSLEDHRQAVLDEIEKKASASQTNSQSDMWGLLGTRIGESIGKVILDQAIERDNYLLFSVTILKFNNTERNIGIGVFGKVWMFEEIQKTLEH